MTGQPTQPPAILSVQRARLAAASAEGQARWVLSATGAGPAALQAARRDLGLLACLPSGHHLRVIGLSDTPEGDLEVDVPWSAEDPGLDTLLAEGGPLPLARVLAVGRGLCASLASLHQQGLVHGGLHPRLVRLPAAESPSTPNLDPYLIGAGWAALRVAWNQRGETDPDILRYLAPEMLRGQASKLDRQTDLFGLGCLIFESLTGRPVFPGTEAEAVREAILRPERPDLRQDLGPAEEPLARVLRRCLASEPADRFPSATALWRELAPALGGKATPLPALHDPGGRPTPSVLGATAGSDQGAPEGNLGPTSPSPAPARPLGTGRRFLGVSPALVTAVLFVVAAAIALGVIAWTRRGAPGEPSGEPLGEDDSPRTLALPTRRPVAEADAAGADQAARSAYSVPPPVPVDPRTARLRQALERVGFTEEEALVSELLRRHVEQAIRAMRERDYRLFDEAMRPVELATRPRECPTLLVQKRGFIIGGIRTLAARLGQWERFRIERMLADADAIPGACPLRSALLRPLVLEVRDRLRQARAQGN